MLINIVFTATLLISLYKKGTFHHKKRHYEHICGVGASSHCAPGSCAPDGINTMKFY
jgi:hypothetical protein